MNYNQVKKIGVNVISVLSFASGVLVFLFDMLALIDPVGTQMANDHDPFGAPLPTMYFLLGLCISVFLIGLPVLVCVYRRKVKNTSF